MANGHRRKAGSHQFDSSCTGSVSSISTRFSELTLDDDETECVDLQDFDLEKGSTREKALSGAIDAFEGLDLLKFVENNNGNETTSSFKKNKEQSTSKNYSPSGLPSLFWSL
ncbi:uncharacterized protein LOC135639614 [Musa acuminata AAA Group]|uniref:uncharacterized protein LOC135639614 n=1 Tax=Musa acuminata AAA Group TaxID=214697 RepID=UPI0031E07B91